MLLTGLTGYSRVELYVYICVCVSVRVGVHMRMRACVWVCEVMRSREFTLCESSRTEISGHPHPSSVSVLQRHSHRPIGCAVHC